MATKRTRSPGNYDHGGFRSFSDPTYAKTLEAAETVDESVQPKTRCGSFVYFLHVPELRRIKIGLSRHPGRRARELRWENGELQQFETRLVGTIDGDRPVERCLHGRFRDHRVNGEWFDDVILPQLQDLARADAEWFGSGFLTSPRL